MSETGSDSSKILRHCGIPFCKNFLGTTDENVAFFRVPKKGTDVWRVWMINLCTNSGIKKSIKNIQELCMLHFKPNNLEMKMQNGKPKFTLKKGAVPLPININDLKSVDTGQSGGVHVPFGIDMESSTSGDGYAGQDEPMQDVKFIDVNEFGGISNGVDVKSEIIIDDEPSTLNKLDDSTMCSSCVRLSIQSQNDNINLQKAKLRILELEKQVIDLMLKIQYLQKPNTQATQATSAAVKVKRSLGENTTETQENKRIKIVNVADIKTNVSSSKTVQATSTSVNHNKAVAPNVEYSCKKCFESFPSMKDLVDHLRIVKQHRTLYECFVCKQYQSYCEKTMRNHIKRHEKQQVKRFRRVCHVCGCKLSVTDFNSHLCGYKVDIQCEYCDDRFTSTKQLCEHLDSLHKSSLQLYRCRNCPKYFSMIFLRDYHQNTHNGKELLTCETCNKQFSNRITLHNHKKIHESSIPTFLCDLCGKGCSSIQNLAMHKNSGIHSGEPTFQCSDCPRKFYTGTHLKRHINRMHTQIKCKCDLCGKWLNGTDGHRKHMLLHKRTEADRRFACNQCPMKFFDLDHLERHKVSHNGIKNFHCKFCDQSYKYSGDLHKHLRTHFKDGRIYECPKCEMRFKYSLELEKHSSVHYKEERAVDGVSDQPTKDKASN